MVIPRTERLRRCGTVLPWLVLSLGVIVGVVALGMDCGRLMDERRHGQAVADAAAFAAAGSLYQNWATDLGLDSSGAAKNAALAMAATNGYANDGSTTAVMINVPPASGAFAGKAGYAEVLVQCNLPPGFAPIASGRHIQARAVAQGRPLQIGIIALNAGAAGALSGTGTSALTVNGSIVVNSSDRAAMIQKAGQMTATSFQVVGGVSSNGTLAGPVIAGAPPMPNPFASLSLPDPGLLSVQSSSPLTIATPGSSPVLAPGIYRGGLTVQAGATPSLLPGVYILDGGGLSVTGSASLTGTGVTIFNTAITQSAGPINISGSLSLTPPQSGPFKGIAILQDPTNNQAMQFSGHGTLNVTGLVYLPAAAVTLNGDSGATTSLGGIIADTLSLKGTADVNIDLGNNYPNVPDITLVE